MNKVNTDDKISKLSLSLKKNEDEIQGAKKELQKIENLRDDYDEVLSRGRGLLEELSYHWTGREANIFIDEAEESLEYDKRKFNNIYEDKKSNLEKKYKSLKVNEEALEEEYYKLIQDINKEKNNGTKN